MLLIHVQYINIYFKSNMEEMKKQWELNRLKALAEEEELKAEVEEDEMFFTASRQLLSQVPRRSRGVRIRRGTRGIRGQSLSPRGALAMSNSSCDMLSSSLFALSSSAGAADVTRGTRGRGRRPRAISQSLIPPFPHPRPLLSSSPPHVLELSGSLSEFSAAGVSTPPSPAKAPSFRKTLPKMEPVDEDIDNDDPDDLSFGERRGRGRGRSGRSRGGGGGSGGVGRRARASNNSSRTSRVDMLSLEELHPNEEDELRTERNVQDRANHIRGRVPTSRGKRSLPTPGDSRSVPAQLQFEVPTSPPGLQLKRSAPPPPPIPVPSRSASATIRQPAPISSQLISVSEQMNRSLPAPRHVSQIITKSRALAPVVPKTSSLAPIRSSLRAGQPDFDSAAAAFRPRSPLAIRPVRIGSGSNLSYEPNSSGGAQNGIAVRQTPPIISRPSAVTIVTYRPPASVGYIPAPAAAGVFNRPEAVSSVQLIPLRPQRFIRPSGSLRSLNPLTIQPIAMRVPASRPGGPRATLSSAAFLTTPPSNH